MSLENKNIHGNEFNDEKSQDVANNALRREEFDVRADEFKENQSNSRICHFSSVASESSSTLKYQNTSKSEDNCDQHDYGIYSKQRHGNLTHLSDDIHVKQETDDMNTTENFYHHKNEENHHEFSRHYFDQSDLSRAMDNVSFTEDKAEEFPDKMAEKFEKSDNQEKSDEAKALPPSNMMFMYLTQKLMNQKIADLEAREQRATMKHVWDEALRLREMKNRMELLREQQIYLHHDLPIDAESKQSAVDGIIVRMQQLLDRKKLCDTMMFSEEAKMLWDKWVEEDKKSHLTTSGHDGSVTLLEQLQEEWMAMVEAEKQKISDSYQHEMAATSDEDKMILINKAFSRN